MSIEIDHPHDFAVETHVEQGVAVVAVHGQADLHTAPELRSALGDLIDGGSRQLLVDLSGTTFLDSMTLGVLIGALKRLAAVDGRLAIACPDRHLRRVFEITSLDRVFAIVESPEQATSLLRDGHSPAA